jgi:hypothetical protein
VDIAGLLRWQRDICLPRTTDRSCRDKADFARELFSSISALTQGYQQPQSVLADFRCYADQGPEQARPAQFRSGRRGEWPHRELVGMFRIASWIS